MPLSTGWNRLLVMQDMLKIIIPLGLMALLIGYHRLAARLRVPKPVYWLTMTAGGFLLMSVFDLW